MMTHALIPLFSFFFLPSLFLLSVLLVLSVLFLLSSLSVLTSAVGSWLGFSAASLAASSATCATKATARASWASFSDALMVFISLLHEDFLGDALGLVVLSVVLYYLDVLWCGVLGVKC